MWVQEVISFFIEGGEEGLLRIVGFGPRHRVPIRVLAGSTITVIHIFLIFSPSSAGAYFVYTLALGEVSANIWRKMLCVRKYSEWYRISVSTHGRRWLIISYEAGTWKSSVQLLLPTVC
jgi:hypothetical protein